MRKKIIKGEYYVYVYLDPRKQGVHKYGDYRFLHELIYVGKGKRKRAYDKERRNYLLKAKLKKFDDPIILLLAEKLVEEKAFELEKFLIILIGRIDQRKGPLCNLTDGGEGTGGHICSEESKKRMSIARTGEKRSDETKKKMSEIAKKRTFSVETRAKIGKISKERIRSEETKRRVSESVKRNWEKRKSSGEDLSEWGRHNMSEELRQKLSASTKRCWDAGKYQHLYPKKGD